MPGLLCLIPPMHAGMPSGFPQDYDPVRGLSCIQAPDRWQTAPIGSRLKLATKAVPYQMPWSSTFALLPPDICPLKIPCTFAKFRYRFQKVYPWRTCTLAKGPCLPESDQYNIDNCRSLLKNSLHIGSIFQW